MNIHKFIVIVFLFLYPVVCWSQPENDRQRAHKKDVRALLADGKIDSALYIAKKETEKYKDEGWYCFQTGEVYLYNIKEPKHALEYFAEAKNRGFESIWVDHRSGEAYFNMKDYKNAVRVFEETIFWSKDKANRLEKDGTKSQVDLIRRELSDRYYRLSNSYRKLDELDKFYENAFEAYNLAPKRTQIMRLYFDANMELAYHNLVNSNYDKALEYFNIALASDVMKEEKEHNLLMYLKEVIRLTKVRKDLGEISPVLTHKMAILFIKHTDFSYKTVKREIIYVKDELTEIDQQVMRRYAGVNKQMVEAMSGGQLSLQIDEIVLDKTITEVDLQVNFKYRIDWKAIDGIGDEMIKYIDKYDTFMWASTAVRGRGIGGAGSVPLPAGFISPLRGYIELNPWHSPNLQIHEFFHVTEAMAGIKPAHGYTARNRYRFSEWKGETNNQMDYFAWHYNTSVKEKGWENMKFRKKCFPFFPENSEVIGAWKESEVTLEEKVYIFKLEYPKAGDYEIIPEHTSRGKAMQISSVSLMVNGKVVSRDDHIGRTSYKNENNVYSILFPNVSDVDIAEIKVVMKPDEGAGTNGVVFIRPVEI